MAIVNFAIPHVLEKKIKIAIEQKGFSSKAELFRFALIRYLEEKDYEEIRQSKKIALLTAQIEKELIARVDFKKLPSLKEQLKRIKNV